MPQVAPTKKSKGARGAPGPLPPEGPLHHQGETRPPPVLETGLQLLLGTAGLLLPNCQGLTAVLGVGCTGFSPHPCPPQQGSAALPVLEPSSIQAPSHLLLPRSASKTGEMVAGAPPLQGSGSLLAQSSIVGAQPGLLDGSVVSWWGGGRPARGLPPARRGSLHQSQGRGSHFFAPPSRAHRKLRWGLGSRPWARGSRAAPAAS